MGPFPTPPLLYLNQVSTNKIIIIKSKINNTTDAYCSTHTSAHIHKKHSNRNTQIHIVRRHSQYTHTGHTDQTHT